MLKNHRPVQEMQEMWARPLGWEDPLQGARQPAPVFLPGAFHGQRSLAGHGVPEELDTTERRCSGIAGHGWSMLSVHMLSS